MKSPSSLYNATALFVASVLAILALAVGLGNDLLADSQAPVTRLLVAECQRFDALATAGGKAMRCDAQPADAVVPAGASDEQVAPPTAPAKV